MHWPESKMKNMSEKILFVDDEPNVLNGLRRMLRPMRHEWEMEFVEGGPLALNTLQKQRYDVIVSDMRMPGISGDQLLEEVRNRYPHMVRIILTGQCTKESGLRALRVAHRMLNKPCDPETLKLAVSSSCHLLQTLAHKSVLALVTSRETLPSLPIYYVELLKELDAKEPSLDKLAEIIGRDVAMLAKLLHLVNSSFICHGTEVTNPKQAVTLLGLEALRHLVLTVGIFFTFKTPTDGPLSMNALLAHCQATALIAGAIARTERAEIRLVELSIIAGLLHDVGKFVFLDSMPEIYRCALGRSWATNEPLAQIEQETFGATHAEVGACLLQLWGLPTPVVEAVAWHHQPNESLTTEFCPLTAVHAANALCKKKDGGPAKLDSDYLERLNLTGRLPVWQELAERAKSEGKIQ